MATTRQNALPCGYGSEISTNHACPARHAAHPNGLRSFFLYPTRCEAYSGDGLEQYHIIRLVASGQLFLVSMSSYWQHAFAC